MGETGTKARSVARMSDVVFLDTETTGLDPDKERVFEVAIVEQNGAEHVFHLPVRQVVIDMMHPKAAEVNRFKERTTAPDWEWDYGNQPYEDIDILLAGKHICGAVPDFDTRHLTAQFKRQDLEPPRWHYHLIDVEALAIGYLAAQGKTLPLPWDSEELSRAVGVEPAAGPDRHTALADALWAKRIYEVICGQS